MRRDDFERLNERQREKGGKTFINPRNTAAGAIRQLDPAGLVDKKLSFFAYGLGETRGWEQPPTHSGTLDAIAALGVPVSADRRVVLGADGLVAFHEEIAAKRDASALRHRRRGLQGQCIELQRHWASSRASRAGRWRTSTRRRSS